MCYLPKFNFELYFTIFIILFFSLPSYQAHPYLLYHILDTSQYHILDTSHIDEEGSRLEGY